ncbi:HAMP domain-containing protein, partial [Levilactobacillus spicheri]
LVGVIYMRSSLDSVYQNINQITLIYVSATFVAIILGLVMAIIISRAITRPIDEMKKQTLRIARGDYSGHVHVYGNDELG